MQFKIYFNGYPPLDIQLDNTHDGKIYYNLIKQNCLIEPPIFRDRATYTVEYMMELAAQAKEVLGWNWLADTYNVQTAIQLHKDIEEILANGFESVPESYDNLLHELHYCLHALQGNPTGIRNGWLQIEWFNESNSPLSNEFCFSTKMNFGDIKLQNPHVGHPPLSVYQEQDNINISQTCKMHDLIRPGIDIVIQDFLVADINEVSKWFADEAPQFVKAVGKDTLAHYTGYPIIGKVCNLDILADIIKEKTLTFNRIEFTE